MKKQQCRAISGSCWLLLLPILFLTGRCNAQEADEGTTNNNPFSKGCFHNKLGHPMRVCHSEDSEDAAELGLCRKPPVDGYLEIGIFCQDWESVLIETWVLQLLLSEIMDVPTTVETGFYESEVNFYDPQGRYDYAFQTQLDVFHSTYREAMEMGYTVGDCQNADKLKDNYQQCAHMVPEICQSETADVIQEYVYNGIFDTPKGLGALGMESC